MAHLRLGRRRIRLVVVVRTTDSVIRTDAPVFIRCSRVNFLKPELIPESPDSLQVSRIRDDICSYLRFLPFLPKDGLPFVINLAQSSACSSQGNAV